MMSASLREMRRERWAAQAVSVPHSMSNSAPRLASAMSATRAAEPRLAVLLRAAIAELLTPRSHAHD